VTFDASGSQGEITKYQWSFGDGTIGEGKIVTHTYRTGGRYHVDLIISDSQGATETASQEIEVQFGKPRACFELRPANPRAGEQVQFDASCSEPQDRIVMYRWSFGDGSFIEGREVKVTHTYKASGVYPVVLVVSDRYGNSDFDMQVVQVQCGKLRPSFVYYPASPSTISIYEVVTFDASASEPSIDIVSYKWDFGDGNADQGKITTHMYKNPGTYTVTLVVTDRCNASEWVKQRVEILKPSVAELIQQDMLSLIRVTVDSQDYFIVYLAHYIDPETLELIDQGRSVKVYTNTEFKPIGQEEIALRVGIIDTAREHAARRTEYLDDFINMLDERWRIHRWLTIFNFFREQLADTLAKAISTYLLQGVTIPDDVIQAGADIAKAIADRPIAVWEAVIYRDFLIAKEEYGAALAIVESASIVNLETAESFLAHVYHGQANHIPAQYLLDNIDGIERTLPDFIFEIAQKVADELTAGVWGRFNDLVDKFRELQEFRKYVESRNEALTTLNRILTVRNWEADYSLTLAKADP
jgi:PKD repeat protein